MKINNIVREYEINGVLQTISFISISENVDNNNLDDIILDKRSGDAPRGACERVTEDEVTMAMI